MKREPIDIDTMFRLACKGNLHLWLLEEDPVELLVRRRLLGSPRAACGILRACLRSNSENGYWCRYDFRGGDIRETLEAMPDYPEHPWHWVPLEASARRGER